MIKVLKFNDFSKLYEDEISVSEPVGVAVLGAPAGGKSYTMKKIKDVADDSRLSRAIDKGVVLTVDTLRDEFLSKNPVDQLRGFAMAFYLMKEKAKENPNEYGKWFDDIKKLWDTKLSKLVPSLNVRVENDKLFFGEDPARKTLKKISSLDKEEVSSAISSLDNYVDYKRVVRYFQTIKQGKAIKKDLDVTYDEAGDEPSKIVGNMKTLHNKGYVTDVFLIHPSNIASNLIQNYYRVVTGGDGGRDSSEAIVQAFKEIEAKKDIYTKNAEVTIEVPSKDIEKTKDELRKATTKDDKERGDKPIDVLAQVEPMPPKEGYNQFYSKLNPEQRDIFDALLKLSALTMDLPEDAKSSLLDLTKSVSNEDALSTLKNAEKSGKYKFKFGGVTPKIMAKAQAAFK
jgi:hypothetical protein